MTTANESTALRDLARQRRELKFAFRGGEFDRLIDLLAARCEPIRFGQADESLVNSVYFDDDQLSSVHESMSGVSVRTKLRLRWYDEPFAGASAYFEVKRRAGLSIGKDRTRVALDRPIDRVNYSRLMQQIEPQLSAPAAAKLSLRRRPTVLVTYRRRHFLEPFSGSRLTVDYDIRGFEQSPHGSPARRFGISVPDRFVLEVKVRDGAQHDVPPWLGALAGRATRSSKYVLCCARMGWCSMTDRHD